MIRCSQKCNARAQDMRRKGRAHDLHAPGEGLCDVCHGPLPTDGRRAPEPTGPRWPADPAMVEAAKRGWQERARPLEEHRGARKGAGARGPRSTPAARPTLGGGVSLQDRDLVRLAVVVGQVVAMLLNQPAGVWLLEKWALIGLQRLREAEGEAAKTA